MQTMLGQRNMCGGHARAHTHTYDTYTHAHKKLIAWPGLAGSVGLIRNSGNPGDQSIGVLSPRAQLWRNFDRARLEDAAGETKPNHLTLSSVKGAHEAVGWTGCFLLLDLILNTPFSLPQTRSVASLTVTFCCCAVRSSVILLLTWNHSAFQPPPNQTCFRLLPPLRSIWAFCSYCSYVYFYIIVVSPFFFCCSPARIPHLGKWYVKWCHQFLLPPFRRHPLRAVAYRFPYSVLTFPLPPFGLPLNRLDDGTC